MSKALPLLKYAAWSPSKASLAGTCPLAFKYRYIDKIPIGDKGTAAKVGVTVHRAQELLLQGHSIHDALDVAIKESEAELTHNDQEKVRSFAQNMLEFQKRINKFTVSNPVKQTLLESKWAVTAGFKSCEFFDEDGIIRGIVDMSLVLESDYVIVIDHKSGRVRPASYYKTQLDFYTVMALAVFPHLKGVQCALHYVAHGKLEWGSPVAPQYIREVLQPWLLGYLNKKAERVDAAIATPGMHCKWCDFREICTFRGIDGEARKGAENT